MAARKKRTPSAAGDGWVAIAADAAVQTMGSGGEPTFVRLRNPATDAASLYMLGADQQLYEVKAFQEDFRSWFVGQTVQTDGRLLFITLMDPLYLIVPYLIKSRKEGKFQPLDQLLVDDDFPACSRLLGCTRLLASLHQIAEEKEVGGLKFHRYSQEKTLNWLEKKVQRTVAALRRMSVSVGAGLKSSTYIRVKADSAPEEDFLRYAHGLVSEYVSGELSAALLTHLQLPELQSPHEAAPPCKKRKLSDKPVEAGEDYSKFNSADFARRPPKKMTTAQKTLAKVDKRGMKPLSSFFSPKVKAEK